MMMKLVKLVSLFFLVSLFSASIALALDLEYVAPSPESDKSIADLTYYYGADGVFIECADPEIEVSLTKEEGLSKFVLITESITLTIFRGVVNEDDYVSVECVSNSTGKIVVLPKKGYKIVSLLRSRVDFAYLDDDHAEFLRTVLNVLDSWPSNLPVLYPTDDMMDLSYASPRAVTPAPGKTLAPMPDAGESICDDQGSRHSGHVLYFGKSLEYNLQEAWTESFRCFVGYNANGHEFQKCFGRCGKGCASEEEDEERYTQRCFNHDGCVDQHGYMAFNCNQMFKICLIDAFTAPICNPKEDDDDDDNGDGDDPFYPPYQ